MRGFAGLIMRGRLPAILVVAAGALVPLLIWVSGAALALVTLRRGVRDGLLVGAGAAIAVAALGSLIAGVPALAMQPVLQLWLPVLLVAGCLRYTASLARALELAAVLAVLAVGIFYALHADPAAYWMAVLERLRGALGAEALDPDTWRIVRQQFAPILTGLWAMNLLSLVLGSLLLGRWWQALLYNPGGFRAEFHGLRLSTAFALAGLALLGAGAFMGPGLVYDIGLVLSSVFVLQTLAVAHVLVASRGWSGAWLVPIYLVLPLAMRALALAGIADAFIDLRRRLIKAA